MDDKHQAARPTTDPPTTDAPIDEELIEDLEAPAGSQGGVVGGAPCGANTYIEFPFKDTL